MCGSEKNYDTKILLSAAGWRLYMYKVNSSWSILFYMWVNDAVHILIYDKTTATRTHCQLGFATIQPSSSYAAIFLRARNEKENTNIFNHDFNETSINGLFSNVSQINCDEVVTEERYKQWTQKELTSPMKIVNTIPKRISLRYKSSNLFGWAYCIHTILSHFRMKSMDIWDLLQKIAWRTSEKKRFFFW